MATIARLRAENVKRLRLVEINCEGQPVVAVGGLNGQGKTSLLDSFMYALAGKGADCAVPIRHGEAGAKVVLETTDGIVVTLKWKTTKTGGFTRSLEVAQKTERGLAKLSSPQAVLDSLCSSMMFDPLEFQRLKPKDQLEKLKELVGVDTASIDEEINAKFAERTDVNRRVKELDGQLAGAAFHSGLPAEEISVTALMQELNAADAANRKRYKAQSAFDSASLDVERKRDEITRLQKQLADAERELESLAEERKSLAAELDALPAIDTAPLQQQITEADTINRKIRENIQANRVRERLEVERSASEALTDDITRLRDSKIDLLANAKWPVPGLGFDENGVTLNELPFSQASAAEQLRVSVAMGFALNPKLKVLLVRDGSLLDPASRKLMYDMAVEHGGQLIMEIVTDDASQCTVLIEDGVVKEVA